MAYADLTPEQKADIQSVTQALRGAVSQLYGVRNKMLLIHEFSETVVDPLIANLADNDVIPNTSGLAGAKDITVAEYKAVRDKVRAYMADAADPTLKPTLIKMAGINAG